MAVLCAHLFFNYAFVLLLLFVGTSVVQIFVISAVGVLIMVTVMVLLVVGVVILTKRRNKSNKHLHKKLPDLVPHQSNATQSSQFNIEQQLCMTDGQQQQSSSDTTMTQNLAYTAHVFRSDIHQDDTNYEYEVPLTVSNVSHFFSNTHHPHAQQDGVTDAQITSNPAYGVLHQ